MVCLILAKNSKKWKGDFLIFMKCLQGNNYIILICNFRFLSFMNVCKNKGIVIISL